MRLKLLFSSMAFISTSRSCSRFSAKVRSTCASWHWRRKRRRRKKREDVFLNLFLNVIYWNLTTHWFMSLRVSQRWCNRCRCLKRSRKRSLLTGLIFLKTIMNYLLCMIIYTVHCVFSWQYWVVGVKKKNQWYWLVDWFGAGLLDLSGAGLILLTFESMGCRN